MESIQIGHLKAEFSEIIHRIRENGETFIVEYGRNHKKVAMLIPYQESLERQSPRIFGVMKNRASVTLAKNFEITDQEFLDDE